MVNGKFVMPSNFRFGNFGWRSNKSGQAVTGENYVEGGKSRGMSQVEVDETKKKRGRPIQTAIESETLGGG